MNNECSTEINDAASLTPFNSTSASVPHSVTSICTTSLSLLHHPHSVLTADSQSAVLTIQPTQPTINQHTHKRQQHRIHMKDLSIILPQQ